MSEYTKHKTTQEVFDVVMSNHSELKVFSSFSDFEGQYGFCTIMTEYGFDGCAIPFIGYETTWDNSYSETYKCAGQKKSEFWLCKPKPPKDDE